MIIVYHGPSWIEVSWPTRRYDTYSGIMRKEGYHAGELKPNYPVPATEFDNCLAMPYDHVMPVMKKALLGRLS